MTSRDSYDSKHGIQARLTDLASLLALVGDRRKAVFERNERLQEFVVLGSWHMSNTASFSRVTFMFDYEPVRWIAEALAPVVTVPDLFAMFPKKVSFQTSMSGSHLPTVNCLCRQCGLGWTVDNLVDAHVVELGEAPPPKFMHTRCLQLETSIKTREYYTNLLTKAGFTNFVLESAPNEYWKSDTSEPWCLCRTVYGNIKLGWRKNVMNIDWSDTKEDLTNLFEDEKVTKGSDHIHAWSTEKAEVYLRKIWTAIQASRCT
jgi:hypothetical protein